MRLHYQCVWGGLHYQCMCGGLHYQCVCGSALSVYVGGHLGWRAGRGVEGRDIVREGSLESGAHWPVSLI